ncbi:MAG: dCTP deaminase [Candidatus Omnitrophica bacterium]|nr:dCTP deaminase [Candidatus Omnitrophota bacterium]
MVKPDHWIIEMAEKRGIIDPFSPEQVKSGVSFGTSSYGYDFRLADEFRVFNPSRGTVIDPKLFPAESFETIRAKECLIPANSFILARSLEYFRIPRDVLAICQGKSTYARCGIIVNVTPFEPEWEGFVTMALSNTAPVPVRVYAGEGIAQVIFIGASEICRISYKDKAGKYQRQTELTLPKC